jgi:hypothetical protein
MEAKEHQQTKEKLKIIEQRAKRPDGTLGVRTDLSGSVFL